jgi:sulfur-oxidizing protein SoxA
MKINSLTLALTLAGTLGLSACASADKTADATYREYTPMFAYGSNPKASDDVKLTNTYQYWKDNAKIDPVRANSPTESWTVNWKYRDPPYDDSLHGGHVAQERGETLYKQLNAKGEFAACMGAKNGNLKGLRLGYPRMDKEMGGIVGLEAKIESCAGKQDMKLVNGSYDNSAVSVYITAFSAGMPLAIDVSKGPLKESFERGKKLFHTKTGWTNFSCATCHVSLVGKNLRGQTPTTPYGDIAHWPTWRTKDELQSLHVRFTECNRNGGTQPLKIGSPEYTDLEVFMTALSNGYPVVSPSQRD